MLTPKVTEQKRGSRARRDVPAASSPPPPCRVAALASSTRAETASTAADGARQRAAGDRVRHPLRRMRGRRAGRPDGRSASGAGSRRRTALGTASGSGRSPPARAGDRVDADGRRRRPATSRASRGGPRAPRAGVHTSATSAITWTRSVIRDSEDLLRRHAASVPADPAACEVAQAAANAPRADRRSAPSRAAQRARAPRPPRRRAGPSRACRRRCARAPAPSCRP